MEDEPSSMMFLLPDELPLLPSWFNRDGQVPLHQMARLFQDYRSQQIIGDLMRAGVTSFVVKTQVLCLDPGVAIPYPFPYFVRFSNHIGRVGTSSLEVVAKVHGRHSSADAATRDLARDLDSDDVVAQSLCVLVQVSPDRTQTQQIPRIVADKARNEPNPLRDLATAVRSMRSTADDVLAQRDVYRKSITFDFSDEDQLYHVNQSIYVRVFEDALEDLRQVDMLAQQLPELVALVLAHPFRSIAVDYVREATAHGGPYEISVEVARDLPDVLNMYLTSKDQLHCRARFFPTFTYSHVITRANL